MPLYRTLVRGSAPRRRRHRAHLFPAIPHRGRDERTGTSWSTVTCPNRRYGWMVTAINGPDACRPLLVPRPRHGRSRWRL